MASDTLIVFAKAPRLGAVKTRLAAAIGPEAALAVHRQLAAGTLAEVASIPGGRLCFAPDDARDEVLPWLPAGWTAHGQGPGDLGARLNRAVADAFADGADRIAVIGADCPYLTAADIRDAWTALDRCDVVLGPATDGGYWLIGLKTPCPAVFEGIAWSTSSVLVQTEAAAHAAGWVTARLRELSDVDTEEDWRTWTAGSATRSHRPTSGG